jgi:hypothetical protein
VHLTRAGQHRDEQIGVYGYLRECGAPLPAALQDRLLNLGTRVARSHRVPGGHEVCVHGQAHPPYANEPDTRHPGHSSRILTDSGGGGTGARHAARPLTCRTGRDSLMPFSGAGRLKATP